ncbi:hypothetical protein [Streptomyces californicus]
MNAPDAPAPTAADRPAHAASPAHASDELRAALSEAGLHAPVTGGAADADVRVGPLAPADARQLARLIRTGTKRTLKTARALREICAGHRIELPGLRVRQGRITLGPVRVEDAARLARVLGAVPPPAARPAPPAGTDAAFVGPCSATSSRRPPAAAPSPYPYGKKPPGSSTSGPSTPGPRAAWSAHCGSEGPYRLRESAPGVAAPGHDRAPA